MFKDLAARPLPRTLHWAMLILSGLGVLDATYLTVTHYLDMSTVCLNVNQCDRVLQSSYATIFGVPVALFGLLYYTAIFTLAIRYRREPKRVFWLAILLLPAAGFLFSTYLVYLQLFVIHAICMYCMISATLTTLIFLSAGLGTFEMYLPEVDKQG